MKTTGNTVLITGGATGIGFALAKAFVSAGNEVIICGRREDKLIEAKRSLPQIHTGVYDLSKAQERDLLCDWIASDFKNFNMLVNNAGIQRMLDFTRGAADWLSGEDEIEINLKAPVHLAARLIPALFKQKEAAIINVSSGLGFIPLATMPVYCATKAALHSFSISLRHQLRNTSIKVFEVIPPMVDTELDKGAREDRGQANRGIPPGEVASATITALKSDQYEVAVGMAQNLVKSSRENPDAAFKIMNRWSIVLAL
ncbi:MAG: SDR family oxidoreductase [Chloroflexi bacterium]|nr:SDR family oxidoreductase [Chloroflexota bacterium]